jgi:hypothetical protein
LPALSPATHKDRDGHEIANSTLHEGGSEGAMHWCDGGELSTWTDRHAARLPVGRVALITFPWLSTAAQKDRDGHETAITCCGQKA